MKPKIFVGSSVEGLPIAYAVQQNLRHTAEVTVWDQGVFNLSETALDSLQEVLSNSDFGIFVLSPDDVLKIQGKENAAARDNVVFELGLFVGKLGKKRCFMLIPDKNAEMHLPTDLVGMTPATYETDRSDKSFQRGSAPACHEIREAMAKLGLITVARNTPETPPLIAATNDEQAAQRETQSDETPQKGSDVVVRTPNWIELFFDKKHKEAVKLLKAELSKAKKKGTKTQILAQIAFVNFDQNIRDGREEFEKLIQAHPNDVHVYWWYSFAWNKCENYVEGINVIDRGLASLGREPSLTFRKVDCLNALGKSNEAIPVLIDGIKEHPSNSGLYAKLAQIHLDMENKVEARKVLVESLKLFPENIKLLEKYGRLLDDLKEHSLAMFVFEKLRDLDPKNSDHWTLLGNQYLMLDFYDFAVSSYKKGQELSSKESSGWILGNIGNLLNNKDFYTESEEFLREGLKIDPTSEYMHNCLSRNLKDQQTLREKAEKIRKEARQKYLAIPATPASEHSTSVPTFGQLI